MERMNCLNVELDRKSIHQLMEKMDLELRFLWQEFQEETRLELRERKEKQFWSLYRTYRKQKEFMTALMEESGHETVEEIEE